MDEVVGAALMDELRVIVRSARAIAPGVDVDSRVPSPVVSVLGLLDAEDGLRLGALARGLGVDASVASRHVATAIDLGLVERRADPVDGRAVQLSLTGAGRAELVERRAARLCWFSGALADWTDGEVDDLLTALRRLRRDLVAASASAAAPGRLPLSVAAVAAS
ncbi:MarR family winged helix-turn-helix transcriptional regulator [Modestobacter sp. SSW1-42]|uniref:MarR family winged helix-turn-helix transcriptional regulator n=1 Tax=Modestobacter sp. SSW1-42 TaxID=596372 RepID=UPI0039887F0A